MFLTNSANLSELLSDHEVELAASVRGIVESPSPVHAEESHNRQEDPDADTGRTLDLERIEITDVGPAVTSLEKDEREYRGLRLKHYRLPQLYSELVIDIS